MLFCDGIKGEVFGIMDCHSLNIAAHDDRNACSFHEVYQVRDRLIVRQAQCPTDFLSCFGHGRIGRERGYLYGWQPMSAIQPLKDFADSPCELG
ncbi:hypothetical protein Voc01_012200 [Virgisporangium ochraceum]|uniref:Uncharacterized protein n=1 Tax=Virgisporangium ochraceum TaxID=65505 RepID=A0A8J3ZNV8_9ACTN|nr:hypothetical protein Voc01_012200 [Virgisporangium ochraceum]